MQRNVVYREIVRNKVADLDRARVMQEQLRVAYCHNRFVGKQRHSQGGPFERSRF